MNVSRAFLLFILFSGIMLSCLDDADCTIDSTNTVNIEFKKYDSFLTDTLEIAQVTLEGTDSIFYEKDTLTSIAIPINPNVGQLPISMSLEDGSSLQFTLVYAVVPRLISEDCGIELKIEQLGIIDHNLDSVALINPSLEVDITTNIELYQ